VRVFACEFVTGGGLAGRALPAELCREGDIMLRALVRDLADVRDIEVVTTRDRRLGSGVSHVTDTRHPPEVHWIDARDDPWLRWSGIIDACDAVWPVAPETGGTLERLTRLVEASGRRLLGSGSRAVELTASKRRTCETLAAHGVAVVPTMPLAAIANDPPPASAHGWVIKPDTGAGAADTFLVRSERKMGTVPISRKTGTVPISHVIQPYIPGDAVSLSLLCRDGAATLLACNTQDVRIEGERLRYHGGIVGAREDRRAVYAPIAARIAAAIPGLAGYVGVDLVDGADGPLVLEINARLTTSYVELRAALGVNPAALVLDACNGAALPSTPAAVRPQVIVLDEHAA
jgi:predicted ATP-grasp superfamily ATP-dependent carboligase